MTRTRGSASCGAEPALTGSAVLAVAAAVTGAVLLMVPAPASAFPVVPLAGCQTWVYPMNAFEMKNDFGELYATFASGQSISGNITMSRAGTPDEQGTAAGSFAGGHIDITATLRGGGNIPPSTAHFTGQIHDDGSANGTENDGTGSTTNWHALGKFVCQDAPAPAAAPAPAPADNPAPEAPPTNAVTMKFERKGLSVQALFTNNSLVAGQCHYDAEDVNGILPGKTDDFPIVANGGATRTYPAPPPLSTYHATVTCHGNFHGQDVVFGNTSQNVSG